MITHKYLTYTFIGFIGLCLVACDTIQKTPSKNTTTNRGTSVNGRTHSAASVPRTNRNTSTPNARGRTHTSVTRSTATTRTNTKTTPTTNSRTTTNNSSRSNGAVATPRKSTTENAVPLVVEIARNYTGTPYRFGGNDKAGIDCSGLICSVYTEAGYQVPRISWQQSEFGKEVPEISQIKPGDWLFFVPEAGKEGYVSHSGIVTEVRGSNEIIFIHASTSKGVREDNLYSTYFKNRFVKAMRPF